MNRIHLPLVCLLLALWALPGTALAQPDRITLSGTVKDSLTGEDLIGATVVVPEANTGAITNAYGFFSLSVPRGGTVTLRVAYDGYTVRELRLETAQNQSLNITLRPFSAEEVVIISQADVISETNMGRQSISMETVRSIPMLFGETDLIRAIQLLPGVQSSGDGNTGYNVRGGGIDQNLILLDEATVYNPSHLMGFFSVFNSDAVKGADLYKGGIPAAFGGRLSSVLDVRMNDGNNQHFSANGGIGAIASRLTLQGPIVKDRGSFIVSGRRTYADMFLLFARDEQVRKNRLYFYDANLKANYKLGERDRIFLSAYLGRDVFGFDKLFRFTWGNRTTTLRWNHIFGDKLFLNTSLIFSDFDYGISFNLSENSSVGLVSGLQNYSVKMDWNYYPGGGSALNFGAQSTYLVVRPGQVVPDGDLSYVNATELSRRYGLENALYFDHDWKVAPRFSVRYGLRLTHYRAMGKTEEYRYNARNEVTDTVRYGHWQRIKDFYGWEPRLGLNFRLNAQNAIKASFDRTVQYINQLTNSASSLPTDAWYPVGTYISPQTNIQVATGYFRTLGSRNQWELSAELYYKWLDNQLDYRDFANLVFNDKIELEIRTGTGRAYGIELMAKKTLGKLTGWVSYTYSRSFRTFPDINGGREFRSIYDRPHYATVVLNYKLSPRWDFGATWIFSQGQPVTFPTGAYIFNNSIVTLWGERNNYRMPAYHRADVSVTWHLKPWNLRRNREATPSAEGATPTPPRRPVRWEHSLNLSCYNAYLRKNAWAINIAPDLNPDNPEPLKLKATKIYLFSIVPSITYNFRF